MLQHRGKMINLNYLMVFKLYNRGCIFGNLNNEILENWELFRKKNPVFDKGKRREFCEANRKRNFVYE